MGFLKKKKNTHGGPVPAARFGFWGGGCGGEVRGKKNFPGWHTYLNSPYNSEHLRRTHGGGKQWLPPTAPQKKNSGAFGARFGRNVVQTSSTLWTFQGEEDGGLGGQDLSLKAPHAQHRLITCDLPDARGSSADHRIKTGGHGLQPWGDPAMRPLTRLHYALGQALAGGVLRRKRKVFLNGSFAKRPRAAHMFNHGWW